MDTDDATVGRIYTRRAALTTLARAGIGLAIGGVISRTVHAATTTSTATTRPLPAGLVAAPALTEGPFFVEEKLNRSDLIADCTRASVAQGMPLALSIDVHRIVGDRAIPLQGAHVELWHCDALGIYSDESNPMNNENTAGQRWLRGYQIAGNNGRVQFQTIVPGWYNGRAPHIHFKVRKAASASTQPARARSMTAEFTSQFFFQQHDLAKVYANKPYRGIDGLDTANTSDGIYSERLRDGSPAGSHLTLELKPSTDGKLRSAEFTILLTDASFDGQRQFGRRGPGGPPPDMFWW